VKRGASARRWRVGILGATGAVGQRLVQLLQGHPWFEISALAASERSAGKPYREAARWYLEGGMPEAAGGMRVSACTPELPIDLALSGLDAGVAGEIEQDLAAAGIPVISNARNHRMEPDVPLLVAEVNAEQARLIEEQRRRRGWKRGFIATNPNCSAIGLVMALKPLQQAFGVRRVLVTTMQAVSGAGYPGVPSLDILGNVIPFIAGEEEKIEAETRKILGTEIAVSAQVHRVAVEDGHLLAVQEASEALRSFRSPLEKLGLPSLPRPPIVVRDEPDRPQPRLDRMAGRGMAVSVGRVRPCPILGIKFNVLSHNTIRGAAGAAILNAEYLAAEGYVEPR
jgi:aspartate-semialdehyde dehydrogenase